MSEIKPGQMVQVRDGDDRWEEEEREFIWGSKPYYCRILDFPHCLQPWDEIRIKPDYPDYPEPEDIDAHWVIDNPEEAFEMIKRLAKLGVENE